MSTEISRNGNEYKHTGIFEETIWIKVIKIRVYFNLCKKILSQCQNSCKGHWNEAKKLI